MHNRILLLLFAWKSVCSYKLMSKVHQRMSCFQVYMNCTHHYITLGSEFWLYRQKTDDIDYIKLGWFLKTSCAQVEKLIDSLTVSCSSFKNALTDFPDTTRVPAGTPRQNEAHDWLNSIE